MRLLTSTAVVLVGMFLFFAGSVLAQDALGQTPAAPPPVAAKIAFMNFSMVLEGTEESKFEISKVRTFMDEKQSNFDQQTRELEQLRQQFTAQERTLNAQTRAEVLAARAG